MTTAAMEQSPSFSDDGVAWGNWTAERLQDRVVEDAMKRLGVAPLLTFSTDGVADDQVEWVAPGELREAARGLRELVARHAGGTEVILDSYAVVAHEADDLEEEFANDLEAVEQMAEWAASCGATRMTLYVSW